MGEEIARRPQQLHARLLLQLGRQFNQLVQVGVGLRDRGAFGSQVAVVEGPVLVAFGEGEGHGLLLGREGVAECPLGGERGLGVLLGRKGSWSAFGE